MRQALLAQCIASANAANQRGEFAAALAWCRQALHLQPDLAEAWYNQGLAHAGLKQRAEALTAFERTRRLTSRSAEAQNSIGLQLLDLGELNAAQRCIESALRISPDYAFALANLGRLHAQRRELAQAEAATRRAIALRPELAPLHVNLAGILNARCQYSDAEAACREALRLDPVTQGAWANLASALSRQKRHEEAAICRAKCLELDADAEFMLGEMLHELMHCCAWEGLDDARAALREGIARGAAATSPFPVLTLYDDPALQRRAAEIYVAKVCPSDAALGALARGTRRDRARIGYFSPDFREHALSYLMAEVFERHDRERFEVYGFSYGPDDDSPMRKRVAAAFDVFVDIRDTDDRGAAKLGRTHDIDIAVDLAGYTTGGRPGIFACRAAPLQVAYLGYLGTSGASYIDYLLADPILIPEAARAHYSEKIAYLPCYQANDSLRPLSGRAWTRADLGLPETGVVFCCFNNAYKITPETFASWMRILGQVDGSVLLLFAEAGPVGANLKREAGRHGVDAGRVIIAGKLPRPDYLTRFRAADLFLDTHPYNAGTTASDALWAGLPVLTRAGNAFACRMAASLLTALGMPELIADSTEDYQARAVALASNPSRLAELKAKLARQLRVAPLFDTVRFTRSLEAAYTAMRARQEAGLPPEDLRTS